MQPPASLSERSDPALHGNPGIRDVNAYIIDRTVGLVRTTDDQFVGTGTLVSIGDKRGILTARHVIKCFEYDDALGIVMPSPFDLTPHRFEIPIDYVKLSYADSIGEKQPDMGIVIITRKYASILSAKKSFCDLIMHRPEALACQPDYGSPIWVLVGTPDEWSRDGGSVDTFKSTREFTLMIGFGVVEPSTRYSAFKCLDFKVDRPEGSGIPASFGGCSGGGLWHVPMTDSVTIAVNQSRLMGVAIEESHSSVRKTTVHCLGSELIYKVMIDVIKRTR